MGFGRRWALLMALAWGGLGCQSRPAAVAPLPVAGPVVGEPPRPVFRITPAIHTLTAEDMGLQLILEPVEGDRNLPEPGRVRWRVEPPAVARIDPGGYLRPLAAGEAVVRAEHPGAGAIESGRITIEPRAGRCWSFAEDVQPILTRAGCNMGGCHGRAEGQNGFHLSFLGYDPAGDYAAIVRDCQARRISRFRAEESLLLAKAAGCVPHGGGVRLSPGSPGYALLLEWLRSGARSDSGQGHGRVLQILAQPAAIRLTEPGQQQIRLIAHYEDGHDRDVTPLATYRSRDDSLAAVTDRGLIELKDRGETDVIVRYQSFVISVRVSVVVDPHLKYDFAARRRANFIDDALFQRLQALGVPPSERSSDAVWLRRVTLDLTGEQPTPEEIREFLADATPDKRVRRVDTLLKRPEFVLFWRIKLGDLLQISPKRQGPGAYRYQAWIDACLKENRPWDQVVKALLTALGDPADPEKGGPVNYALDGQSPAEQAELTAQRFLGIRLKCAQCHDHPFDVWTQDDYFGMAAFFAKLSRQSTMAGRQLVTLDPGGQVMHLRTRKAAQPKLLGRQTALAVPDKDPRVALADWITRPDNPYFARATANWVWAQLFGKGLVDPADDMSQANPPVHPQLLSALAEHFVRHRFDLRDLIRTIAVSEAYGLSSAPVAGNERDSRLFSHQQSRPLSAHQMADAIAQATDVPNRYPGVNPRRRAIETADPTVASTILDTFGRCRREESCTPTANPSLTLAQALLLMGGDIIESKVASLNGYLASALKLELEPEELVDNLYFRTVCRPPTAEESSRWSAELRQAADRSAAAEDLFWALLNSREFAFNH